MACINPNSPEFKAALERTGGNPLLAEINVDGVNYTLKATSLLQSSKADQFFASVAKNKISGDVFWKKMQSDLAVPKEQLELLKSFNTTDRNELIANMLANYSFAIEINVAKSSFEKVVGENEGYGFNYQGSEYNAFFNPGGDIEYEKDGQQISEVEYFKAKKEGENKEIIAPSQYYSNLTVPGGTNYTENEIATAAITPSIKGHAKFATDQGIAWFRSDDKAPIVEGFTENKEAPEEWGIEDAVIKQEPKTRRILELQSDYFQKLRNRFEFNNKIYIIEIDSKTKEKRYISLDKSGEFHKRYSASEYNKIFEDFIDAGGDNQFLALLHKGDNWITFFIKSIIQDSAKKGYEKVVFPTGSTAYKIESGGNTIEDFIKNKENRIKDLEQELVDNKKKIGTEVKDTFTGLKYTYTEFNYEQDLGNRNFEIKALEKEIEDAKKGASGLAATAKFYEETVKNVLIKQYGKENVKQVTDEYGNTWNEIVIVPEREQKSILLQKEGTETSVASPKTIALVKDFLKRIGVDIKKMQEIVINGKRVNANGVALIMQKLVQVVEGKEAVALPEEAMHFAVEIIKQTNAKLYNQLLKEINNYALYKQVLADYGTDPAYQGKDGKPDIQKLKEEAIAKVLVETIINQNEGSTEKPELLAKSQSWWSSIVEWLKGLFMKSGFDRAAMSILSGENIGTVDDVRAEEGKVFLQKTKQQEAIDKLKSVDSRLTKKEVEEDGEMKERYFLDGVTKIPRRVSDEISDWYERRFRGGELLKTEYAKAVDDLKGEKGTKGHADFEYLLRGLNDGKGGVLVDENGLLRDEPLDDSGYVPQMDPNDLDREIYETLKENLLERLRSFPKGTVFLSETQIYDPKSNKAGTIDLIAITPEGKVNVLDWKFMALSDAYDDVPWYKVAAWKNQMDQYKTMLINAYGIKGEQFEQTRMIPIKAIYSEGNRKQKVLPRLLSVEIGAVDPKDVKDSYLLPVGLEEEKTGNDDVDELLKKLNADYRKLSEKTVLPSEKRGKAEQLNALFTAIRQLQMRQNLKPLLEQAKIFNFSIKNLMERFEKNWKGKDPKSFSEAEVNAFTKELADAEKALKTYTTLDVDLADLFSEGEDADLENDLAKTVKIARSLENKLDRVKTNFVRDFIGKAEEVEDVTKEEKTISGLAKWWSDTATIQLNSAKILFRKVNRMLTFAAMDSVNESRKLQNIKTEFDKWARGKGLSNKNYFDIIKKKGSNELIDEFKSEFYKELKKKINSKDPDLFSWIKDNIKISEYNAFLKEEIANEKKRIIEKYKDREKSEENEDKMNNELSKVDKMYNTSTTDGIGWYQYELIKMFPKEKWQTTEWKELHAPQNKPALDFYNYIRERNEYYRSIGYLSRGEDRTFLPWVRKSLVEKLAMGGNIAIGEQFLRSISMDEGDVGFGKTDPHTGRPIDTIPKYFTTPIEGEASTDLFKNMALYNEMAIRFKYLSDIEDQALALVDLERNKSTIATSIFSKTKYKDGKVEISPDNSKNAELIESMVKGIVYGQKFLQNDGFDQVLGKFGKIGENINKKLGVKIFPEGMEGKQISLNKSINTLNRMFQLRTMGLNVLSATSNLFGGTAQSLINSGKYFTKSDYLSVESWINAKMIGLGDAEYRKKAIGALEYFLPLTENYNREIAKKLSLNKLNQENIQDALMILMRQSDKHVQTVNFFSFLRNSIVENGEVVNAREVLRKTPEYANIYELTAEQRKIKEDQFEEDVKKLIDEKGVLKLGQIVDNQFVIPGVERKSESVVAIRRKIQQVSKDALGNMTDDSRRLIDMNIYGSSFMVFKNWIPRLIDVRMGGLKYNSASDAYEWGRMRTVYSMLSLDLIKSFRRLRNSMLGNENGVKYMRELWEKKKENYERETGKTLEMTEAEFMELVRRNVKAQIIDAMFFATMMGLVLALKAAAPDDDEDPLVKNQYRFLMRAADKLRDEIAYFYNPANLLELISGGVFPSIGLLKNFEKLIENFMQEMFGLALDNDEWVESAKPIKYLMKTFPITTQIANYMPMFAPEVAKDLGIKAQSQSGFAR